MAPRALQGVTSSSQQRLAVPAHPDGIDDMGPYAFEWGERVLIRGDDGFPGQVTPRA